MKTGNSLRSSFGRFSFTLKRHTIVIFGAYQLEIHSSCSLFSTDNVAALLLTIKAKALMGHNPEQALLL